MIIKVLGAGCRRCATLAENAKAAADALGKQVEIIKVTDFEQIGRYGLLSTPGLVIDEKLVASGKVLSPEEIKLLL
jgi:small redox-active disulfide protein 2